jgi:DNA mismatch repair ATPase MutS
MLYSIGFNGYLDCMEGLQGCVRESKINLAHFIKEKSGNLEKETKETKDKKETKETKETKDKKSSKKVPIKQSIFENSYYGSLVNQKPVKNTVKFNKNLIITGPNASGKSTILKSTLINVIFTQQFGCGFYDSAKLAPFQHIHCYLNIPDTSGRDSLFQAEARRCKEILDLVQLNKEDTHFCIFDELYSGTNPEEAETSAVSFMKYLQKYKNVSSMLTTHFINVCRKLGELKTIENKKMLTEIDEKNGIKYRYQLKPGISDIKGGVNVLTEMNYPREIIENTIRQLQKKSNS